MVIALHAGGYLDADRPGFSHWGRGPWGGEPGPGVCEAASVFPGGLESHDYLWESK